MAHVIRSHDEHIFQARTSSQRLCVALGIIFVTIGLTGVAKTNLLGMHLSSAHNFIHLLSGSLCLWSGFAEEARKSYIVNCTLGIFYTLLGITGFVFGTSGYPSVGDYHSDSHLWRVLPGFLEFASHDHTFHILVGFLFLLGAFAWKMKTDSVARSIVDIQRRK